MSTFKRGFPRLSGRPANQALGRDGLCTCTRAHVMGFNEKCGAIGLAVGLSPGAAHPARPKAAGGEVAAVCMVVPAQARRPRGGAAYLSFRRLGGRSSPLQEQCRKVGGCRITKVAKEGNCWIEPSARRPRLSAGGHRCPSKWRGSTAFLGAPGNGLAPEPWPSRSNSTVGAGSRMRRNTSILILRSGRNR